MQKVSTDFEIGFASQIFRLFNGLIRIRDANFISKLHANQVCFYQKTKFLLWSKILNKTIFQNENGKQISNRFKKSFWLKSLILVKIMLCANLVNMQFWNRICILNSCAKPSKKPQNNTLQLSQVFI